MHQKYLRLPVDALRKEDSMQYCLFCLPSGGRDLLLAMAERMLWDIYVNEDGSKAALSDSEWEIVDQTIRGLIMSCDFSTIATALDNIATALDNLEMSVTCAPDVSVTCGSGSDFIVYPGPGLPPIINPGPLPEGDGYDEPLPFPDGFPTTPIDPETEDPPAGWEDWESYDVDACKAANAVVEYAYQWARQNYDFWAQDIYTLGQLVVVVVNILTLGWGVLFSRALIIKMATVAYKMKDSFTLAGIAEFFAGCMDYIQENRQELVCSIYSARVNGSDSMNNFIANMFGWAAGTAAYVADAPLITELFGYFFPPSMFGAAMVSGIGYSGANAIACDVCDPPYPTISGLHWEFAQVVEVELYDDRGQSYELTGNTFRVFGANHPGNVKFGYNLRFLIPAGFVGLAMSVTKETVVQGRTRDATGHISFVTGETINAEVYPTIILAKATTETTALEEEFMAENFQVFAGKLTEGIDREWGFFGPRGDSSYLHMAYDVSFANMYFLVRD